MGVQIVTILVLFQEMTLSQSPSRARIVKPARHVILSVGVGMWRSFFLIVLTPGQNLRKASGLWVTASLLLCLNTSRSGWVSTPLMRAFWRCTLYLIITCLHQPSWRQIWWTLNDNANAPVKGTPGVEVVGYSVHDASFVKVQTKVNQAMAPLSHLWVTLEEVAKVGMTGAI